METNQVSIAILAQSINPDKQRSNLCSPQRVRCDREDVGFQLGSAIDVLLSEAKGRPTVITFVITNEDIEIDQKIVMLDSFRKLPEISDT